VYIGLVGSTHAMVFQMACKKSTHVSMGDVILGTL
jgi:hypothetical protein